MHMSRWDVVCVDYASRVAEWRSINNMDVEKALRAERLGPVLREWLTVLESSDGDVRLADLPVGDLAPVTVRNLRKDLVQFGVWRPVRPQSSRRPVEVMRVTDLGRMWLAGMNTRVEG